MMRRKLLYLSIIITFFVSCKKVGGFLSSPDQKPTEQSSVDSLQDGDRPSDSSGGVPGYLVPSCSMGFSLNGTPNPRCVASEPGYRFTGLNPRKILSSPQQASYSLDLLPKEQADDGTFQENTNQSRPESE